SEKKMHVIPIQADPSSPTAPILVPPWLEPLMQWDRRSDLTRVVSKIVEHLGFTSMVYAAKMARSQQEHERVFFWTTAPQEWVQEYDRESYVEIDPRIKLGLDTPPPLTWDNSLHSD